MKADGTIDKYKARLVIKGFKKREGLDYFDTYSPVTRITSIRMILAIVVLRNLGVHQMDVKMAFLNRDLEEEIYMNQPEGFIAPGQESKVCRLVKSLYGLKQAPKQRNQNFDHTMLESGFKINDCDKCVYIKYTKSGYVILCLYVDDMLIIGGNDKMIKSTKDLLQSKFDMKDMGLDDVILRIKIIRTHNGLVLSQAHYVDKILNTHNAGDSGPARTPIDTNMHLSKNKTVGVAQLEYSKIIDMLMYLKIGTWPDLAYAISRLSRYPTVIKGYSDANWISNIKDSRSTSGYVFTLGGAAISWKSSQKTVIAKSPMQLEFIVLDKCGEKPEWLRQFIEDIPRGRGTGNTRVVRTVEDLSVNPPKARIKIDVEQQDFLADGLEGFDSDCKELQLNATSILKTANVDAYDSEVDDAPTASEIVMAKLSPAAFINGDEVGPSYDSYLIRVNELKQLLTKLKGKSQMTQCEMPNLDSKFQKLKDEIVSLSFQVSTLVKERKHLKIVYKNIYDSINQTRAQNKHKIDSLQEKLNNMISKNARVRAQLQAKFSEQKNRLEGTSANIKFEKPSTSGTKIYVVTPFLETRFILKVVEKNDLSKIVTSHLNTNKVIEKCTKVLAPGLLRIKFVPINACFRNNKVVHQDYLKITKEHIATLQELLEQARAMKPSDENLEYAYKFSQRIQELLVYIAEIVLWYLDSGCSKNMTGQSDKLINFVSKFIGTVRFGNDHFAAIMGYGDLQIDNILISRLAKEGLVKGFPKLAYEKDHLCSACQMAVALSQDITRATSSATIDQDAPSASTIQNIEAITTLI
uniref:Retrotransposon protein, putative, Ty1-copia subclass n=1 Tax=Tanacetum cinerariifolium TaxID=118510 RepID=A0A6L2JPQ3_TANCI|nr:retrotransposon protein, putative, Ty1-copia subclass [Tanacetum cinerariifolium]